MYGGVPYSALSQVELDFVAPASLAISNVEVGGVGYSGTLEYAGGNQLRVTGIRRVTLPPTEAEAAAAAISAGRSRRGRGGQRRGAGTAAAG